MDTTKQETTTEPVNGHLAPDEISLELNIPCPEHPDELIQRISINNQIEKEVLCVECLIGLEDPKTAIPNLVSPGHFVKLAHDFYQNSDKNVAEPSQIPSEYQTLLLKQAENIDKVSHHIEKEKKKVEDKYKAMIQEFTNLCNQKKEEHLSNLDKQLFNFRYNYVYFEKQLNKAYPSEQEETKPPNPTKEVLVEKFQKVSNATQLMTLIKNIKQDLKEANFNPIAPQDNSEETRKKNLDTLAKAMQAQLSQLPTIVPPKFTTEEDIMKGFKENMDKTLSKLLEMEKEIFDLTKGENVPSSKILTTPEQLTLLKKWLNKGSLNLKLLYRASKDGFTGTAFHSKCDGVAETITVIKAEGTNKIFGGYLDQAWQTKEAWINSDKCFVFSLTSKEKYVQKSGHEMYAAYGGSSYGPSFGGGYDFHISGKSGGALLYSFEITDLNNFTGGSSFTCEEIEVFQITKDSGFSEGTVSNSSNSVSNDVKQKVADYMGVSLSSFKLLYKGSENGMTPESFHEKCDNKGPTVIFVKPKDSEDVIGGYTSQPWCAKESYALDNEAFIFSIEKELFCPVTIAESAIFQTASTGPYFGDDESLVVFKEKQGGKYNVVSNANDCYQEGDVFSNKGMSFEPEEVEVYEVPY